MGSAFHQLCPRYSGTLTPLPLQLIGYEKPLPFYIVEFQWLKNIGNYENMFATGVVRANEC